VLALVLLLRFVHVPRVGEPLVDKPLPARTPAMGLANQAFE